MDKEMNTLSEIHYRHEFGERKLYRLKFSDEKVKSERDDKQGNFHSQWLFGKDVTYTKLASMLSKKARIKITNITDSYSFEQYKADNKQFVPLYTIDKEGKLHVITDKFDGVVPRDRKLISLVVEDEVQPKPVDVTPKQEQARMAADASFESSSKAPEKRKEKELSDDSADATAQTTDSDSTKETIAEQKITEQRVAEQRVAEQNADNEVSNHSSDSAESKTTPDTLNDKVIASKDESIDVVNKGVMSANSTATSKATPKNKVSNSSSTNGNGNAPKTKKGALDPNRLPDSGQDNTANASSDVDINKDNINKDNVQEISDNKAVNKQDK
jgi:hypothetical protein